MRLSKKSEYALRALVCMARAPSATHTISALSEAEHIPPKFLEQIFLHLRHAGILASRRGAGGGYTLSLPSSRVRVLDVISAVEGKAGLLAEDEGGSGPHAIKTYLAQLEKEIRDLLAARTIDDLVRAEQQSAGSSFEI